MVRVCVCVGGGYEGAGSGGGYVIGAFVRWVGYVGGTLGGGGGAVFVYVGGVRGRGNCLQ